MATNPYIRLRPNRERNLVSDLHKEMIRNFGIDVEYMVRDEVSVDKIFGEDTRSKFSTSRKIEMYVESADGFEGVVMSSSVRSDLRLIRQRSLLFLLKGSEKSSTTKLPRTKRG